MQNDRQAHGSSTRWGPLFGERAHDWAETWEGNSGWGAPIYENVLDWATNEHVNSVLDCGCGAGRFARTAANRGMTVAGIDAAEPLIRIAAERTPAGDFRVGDLEALPWRDDAFDLVTGFSAFQFADDKVRALGEARRVSRGSVVIVIPSRGPESGITAVLTPAFPLYPPEALESMKHSGIFALSEPGRLEETLAAAYLTVSTDNEIESPAVFNDVDTAVRAFVGAGPTALAIQHSGEQPVSQAVRDALRPYTAIDGRITLPGWYRVVTAQA